MTKLLPPKILFTFCSISSIAQLPIIIEMKKRRLFHPNEHKIFFRRLQKITRDKEQHISSATRMRTWINCNVLNFTNTEIPCHLSFSATQAATAFNIQPTWWRQWGRTSVFLRHLTRRYNVRTRTVELKRNFAGKNVWKYSIIDKDQKRNTLKITNVAGS